MAQILLGLVMLLFGAFLISIGVLAFLIATA
jgi:hypothetical protein